MARLLCLCSVVSGLFVTDAQAQFTRVSVASNGTQSDNHSNAPGLSADGHFLVFASIASNLVPNDTNAAEDIFVRDLVTGTTTRVSVRTGGAQGSGLDATFGQNSSPVISADGRFVAFTSAFALVPEDTHTCAAHIPFDNCEDVYVHDRQTGETTRVSVATDGTQANGDSFRPSISGDGRFVVFESFASNLVPDDDTTLADVFLHDRQTRTTTRLTSDMTTRPNSTAEQTPVISADGQFVAFGGFTPVDTLPPAIAGTPPVCGGAIPPCPVTFLFNRATGAIELLSDALPPLSGDAFLFSEAPLGISADGGTVTVRRALMDQQLLNVLFRRDFIHDRATGRTIAFPQHEAAGPAQVGLTPQIRALSGDGRHYVIEPRLPLEPPPDGTPEVRFVIGDRLTGLEENVTLPFSRFGNFAHGALSSDGRRFAFLSRAPVVASDTNEHDDIYVLDRDPDGDGLPTVWETAFGLNPDSNADASTDSDGDSVSNLEEYRQGTNPRGHPDFTRYLAEGAANVFFSTRIALFNPGDEEATAVLRLLGTSGATKMMLRTVPARSRITLEFADGSPDLPENNFSTVVESDRRLIVDRTLTWGGPERGPGSHTETASASPETTWFFAEGATHGGFDLFYLFQNPGDADATVTVTYLRRAPLAPVVRTYGVPARSRVTIWVDDQGADLDEHDLSARIESTEPIIVERAQYLSTPSQIWAAGHDGLGLTAPSTRWFFPEGATGTFFDLFLLLANPGTEDTNVGVTYLLPNGAAFSKTYTLAAESRRTISVEQEDARLAGTAVAMVVETANNEPIVAERAMWWPSEGWYGAHLSAGTTSTSTQWALADGEAGVQEGRTTETYVLVANTSTTNGRVTLTFFPEEGEPITRTVDLAAQSRLSFNVSGALPDSTFRRFATFVDSDVPIVVERAIYSTVDGVFWATGTSAVGTPVP